MFFFPLHDDNPTRRRPFLSWALIAACALVFVWQLSLGADMHAAIAQLGIVPAALFGNMDGQNLPAWMTIFSSMFLHGGFMHLLTNMLFLWIFGDNVEDCIGRGKYLGFYLLCGIAAALAQAGIDPQSRIPMIGSSGAIAGILGAYLMLHPFANVRCIVGFFIFFRFINLPAWTILGAWIGLQFFNLGQLDTQQGGPAYVAHIGGFLAGMLLIFFFKQPNIPLFARAHSRAFEVQRVRRSPHLPQRRAAPSRHAPDNADDAEF